MEYVDFGEIGEAEIKHWENDAKWGRRFIIGYLIAGIALFSYFTWWV